MALEKLDQTTAVIIREAYFNGESIGYIATVHRCSRQNIHDRINRGFYQIIHGKYCRLLETFMWDGYHVNPQRLSDYVDTEEIDSVECDLLIMEEV